MIEANVLKNAITLTEREQMTSGSVNVYHVHFHFSSHWDDLEKVAIFKTPTTIINVPIEDNVCVVPWEVTTTPGLTVDLGVYGIKASQIILPTIWIRLGTIVEGVFIGEAESGDHTPDIYDAILSKMHELLEEVQSIKDVTLSSEDIETIIERYFKEHPSTDSGLTAEQVNNLIKQYLTNNQVGITEKRVQEMIDTTVGAAIADGY